MFLNLSFCPGVRKFSVLAWNMAFRMGNGSKMSGIVGTNFLCTTRILAYGAGASTWPALRGYGVHTFD
jgi:hypothetical protein